MEIPGDVLGQAFPLTFNTSSKALKCTPRTESPETLAAIPPQEEVLNVRGKACPRTSPGISIDPAGPSASFTSSAAPPGQTERVRLSSRPPSASGDPLGPHCTPPAQSSGGGRSGEGAAAARTAGAKTFSK